MTQAARQICLRHSPVLHVLAGSGRGQLKPTLNAKDGALRGQPFVLLLALRALRCPVAARKPSAHLATSCQTRFLHVSMPTAHKYTNALAKATDSPYLLQHAHNPVNWYPWGEEAFRKAKDENKPIFLSIGYSTCHWCHVMEHESFENEGIAKLLNENFVAIKVDRETQPDIDAAYMTFVQATTQHGGWPLSVFLTPDLHPIFGGTYFPPVDQLGRPGFSTVIGQIATMWKSDAEKLRRSGIHVVQQLQEALSGSFSTVGSSHLESYTPAHRAFASLSGRFDSRNGGFGDEPKFPTPVTLHFLLRYHYIMSAAAASASNADRATVGDLKRLCHELGDQKCALKLEKVELVDAVKVAGADRAKDAQKALDMTCLTLKKIARGGIHDHIGCGFHRYSTDRRWHVPHFEKMLYDQGQLACAYAEAYSITKDEELANAARDIMQYVKECLTHPQGGFYSAEDADSFPYEGAKEKKEGAFCVFTAEEIASLLKEDDRRIFNMHFGIKEQGNVDPSKDIQGELENQNVLMEHGTPEETASKAGVTVATVRDVINRSKSILKKYRKEKRPPPHLDDKVLVAWNGLMISGCVAAGNLLQEPKYIDMAERAATFLKKFAYNETSRQLRRSVRGEENPTASGEGFTDDYTYLIRGLLDLYEATFKEVYALWALDLQRQQDSLFWDTKQCGYFGSRQKPDLVLRLKPEHDGAEPSAGSVAAENLIRLSEVSGDTSYATKAKELINSYQGTLAASPMAMPYLVASLMLLVKGLKTIVITGNAEDDENVLAFRNTVSCRFMPDKVLWLARPGSVLAEHRPTARAMVEDRKGKPAAFVCANGVCERPVENPADLQMLLTK